MIAARTAGVYRLPYPAFAHSAPLIAPADPAADVEPYVSDRDRAVGYFGAGKPASAEIPHYGRPVNATNSVETLAAKLESKAAQHEGEIDDDVAGFLAEKLYDLAQTVRERGIRTVAELGAHLDFRF